MNGKRGAAKAKAGYKKAVRQAIRRDGKHQIRAEVRPARPTRPAPLPGAGAWGGRRPRAMNTTIDQAYLDCARDWCAVNEPDADEARELEVAVELAALDAAETERQARDASP